ncbi:MAG: mechanosensitive ion channel [Candidatus Moranbacteria bacterium]|nr:mechanosensitive ion channel [Candidatus Moranbacteria bacterium]
MQLQDILDYQIAQNTGKDYLISIAIFLIVLAILKIFKSIVFVKLMKASKKTKTDIDDFLVSLTGDIKPIFYFIFALFISIQNLQIPSLYNRIIYTLFLIALVYQVIIVLQKAIDYITEKIIENHSQKDDEETTQAGIENEKEIIKFASRLVKYSLWIFGIVLILSNLNVNVTSLITGLGIGGIAMALAVQNILSDVFSSVSIFVDKPFSVGDFISTKTESGTVKKIGIKTTRIISLTGEELVVPNKDLTESRIHNFKKLEQRRISFNIGVVYETDIDKLKKVREIIKKAIEQVEIAECDRVRFKEFGDSSLNFEAVMYINSKDYSEALEAREQINFQILEAFNKEKIEFAYPTRSIILNKQG